ncbi:nitroreductase family protein [Terrilactibacillus sp. S3-3]|nr:nitroreductase family protein [Terrilactibacillus sp. S3-3]
MMEKSLFDLRHTVRMYTDQPVPKDVLFKVLADAQKAPSWANSQPWEVYVAVGEPLARLKAANIASFEKKKRTWQ